MHAAGFATWNMDLIVGTPRRDPGRRRVDARGPHHARAPAAARQLLRAHRRAGHAARARPVAPPRRGRHGRRLRPGRRGAGGGGLRVGGDLELGAARARVPPQPPLLGPGRLRGFGSAAHSHAAAPALVERAHARPLRGDGRRGPRPARRRGEPRRRDAALRARSRSRCARAAGCAVEAFESLDEVAHLVDVDDGVARLNARGRLLANQVILRLGPGAPDGSLGRWPRVTTRRCSTRSSTSPSGGASSSPRPRSTAGFRSTYDYGPLGVNMLRNVRAGVVALDGPAARRRRRPGRGDPRPAGGVGGVGPPRDLHRPAGGLPQVQGALARRQDRRRLPQLRVDASSPTRADFNLMFKTPGRPGRGRGRDRLPATRDRPGDVHQLPQRPDHDAAQAALRHRPDRQVVPQRDHPAELRLSHARVRADGDGVLRRRRPTPTSGTATGSRSASTGTSTSASRPIGCASTSTRPPRTRHYSKGTTDIEFLYPWGWDELEGVANRGDYDLTQHSNASGVRLEYFDQATETSATPPTSSSRPPARRAR